MYPAVFACYTQKTLSHFLLNTRGCSIAKTLLSPPQKGRRKLQEFLRKDCEKAKQREDQGPPLPGLAFALHQGIVPKQRRETSPRPTGLGILSAPRDSTEAASLTTLGPHGQNAHNPRGYIGGYFPLCTFSLGFGAAETAFHLG